MSQNPKAELRPGCQWGGSGKSIRKRVCSLSLLLCVSASLSSWEDLISQLRLLNGRHDGCPWLPGSHIIYSSSPTKKDKD